MTKDYGDADVFADAIAVLVELGWLAAADPGNRVAVKAALKDFVDAAAVAGIRPDQR